MRQRLGWLLTIQHPDDDVRRRGANFVALALMLAVISSLLVVIWLVDGKLLSMIAASGIVTIAVIGIVAARRGYVNVSAWVVIIVIVATVAIVFVTDSEISNTPFFLLIPMAIAGLLLPPAEVALVLAIVALAYLGATLAQPVQVLASRLVRETLQDSIALLFFVGFSSLLSAASARVWLRAAIHAQAAAEHAAAQFERTNAELEVRVAERTRELERSLLAQQAQAAELGASLAQQQALNELINTLSLPLIPVRSDVLVAPLVGNLDTLRAQQLIGQVLRQIEQRRARAVILDITGVAVVDMRLAQVLLNTADAARLLGAQTILVGIRPEVSQTLVSLGGDLGRLRTGATLQDGLALVD